MGYNFSDGSPIYLQIIDLLKKRIIAKKYLPKQKLPSVRELSFELEVNPNTIQKALLELESDGLIYTDRTNGKFVTEDESLIEKTKDLLMKNTIDDFYKAMKDIEVEVKKVLIEKWSEQ